MVKIELDVISDVLQNGSLNLQARYNPEELQIADSRRGT